MLNNKKNHCAPKIENRILKQTHDTKLAENLSAITKNIEEGNESTRNLGEVIEKPQPENNIPQPAIEDTQPHQPIENNNRSRKQ